MSKPDWEAVRKEMEAAQARYEAVPIPTEDTIPAIAAALKNEGFKSATVRGVHMTVDEMVFHDVLSLNDWRGLLRDWRYVNTGDKT